MTEQLKQAAQQALGALLTLKSAFFKKASTPEEVAGGCDKGYEDFEAGWVEPAHTAIAALERALTQRPAAQAGVKCNGENCTAIDGVSHSAECIAEHERTVNAGRLDTPGHRASLPTQPAAQATPEPVGDAYHVKLLIEAIGAAAQKAGIYNGQVPLTGPLALMLVDDMATCATRPAQGVPDDSALLDYLDTLAARPAGSDLHCFGGRVVLYVRTGIGSQVQTSGSGTSREAIRAAMLAAAQAKGGGNG